MRCRLFRRCCWLLVLTQVCVALAGLSTRAAIAGSQKTQKTLLLLFSGGPSDPLLDALRQRLRSSAGGAVNTELERAQLLTGPLPSDPEAWQQASALARAALWFMLGRQCLTDGNDGCTLRAFDEARASLYNGGLNPRAQLLASLSLISGRIMLERGDEAGADAAFRTAAFVDPDDASEQVPEGVARDHYLAARRWVQDSSRLPVHIEASTPGATLYVNGSRVNGEGTSWVLELPPGEHVLAATREGMLTASARVRLEAGAPRPDVLLRLQPGTGCRAASRSFSLAEANGMMGRLHEVLVARGASRAIIEAVVGPADGSRVQGPGPRTGLQSGIRRMPGPDPGEEPPPPMPMKVELFEVSLDGRITHLETTVVGP